MISIERDLLGVVKGLPPKGYIYPEGVLLGCDDNIGATVTAFCGVALLDICRALPFARYLIVPCFYFSILEVKKWKVLCGLSCRHS